jgi:hypothetical protein
VVMPCVYFIAWGRKPNRTGADAIAGAGTVR